MMATTEHFDVDDVSALATLKTLAAESLRNPVTRKKNLQFPVADAP